jgi:hypothetical protein
MTDAEIQWTLLSQNERHWRALASQHRDQVLRKEARERCVPGTTEYRNLQSSDLLRPWTPWLVLCYHRWMTLDAMDPLSPVEVEECEDLRRKLLVTSVFEEDNPVYRVESLGVVMVVYENGGARLAHAFPDVEKFGIEKAYNEMWGCWPGWYNSGELPVANSPDILAEIDASEPVYDNLTDYHSATDHLFPEDFDASKIRRPWEKGGEDE